MGRQKTFLILLLSLALTSCGGFSKHRIREGARPKAETRPMAGQADECGIWTDKNDPQRTVVIANDKSALGALYVYDLEGNLIAKSGHMNRPVGVSVRYDIELAGEKIDVIGCGIRTTNQVKLFKIDPETRQLTDITTEQGISSGFPDKTYGFCLYKRLSDGKLFAFVSRKETDDIHQIEFHDDGTGKFAGTIVRKFGKRNQRSFVEGMVADDEYGYFYCCDEQYAILKYYADPSIKRDPFIRSFGLGDGIRGDREGLGIYRQPKGRGYLIVSSQGDSTFKIYDRAGNNKFIKSAHLRGVTKTDGIGVTALSIPPKYPTGLFAAHNDSENNYLFFDWYEFSHLK